MGLALIISADGTNSHVVKVMGVGAYNFAVTFQKRIKISGDDMILYKNMAKMYVGDDASPRFYDWVFPKYDHFGF